MKRLELYRIDDKRRLQNVYFPERVKHDPVPIVLTYSSIHYIRGMIKDSLDLAVRDQPYVNSKTGLGSNLPDS